MLNSTEGFAQSPAVIGDYREEHPNGTFRPRQNGSNERYNERYGDLSPISGFWLYLPGQWRDTSERICCAGQAYERCFPPNSSPVCSHTSPRRVATRNRLRQPGTATCNPPTSTLVNLKADVGIRVGLLIHVNAVFFGQKLFHGWGISRADPPPKNARGEPRKTSVRRIL